MTTPDLTNPSNWARFADGYVLCPFCCCVTHPQVVEFHNRVCEARKAQERDGVGVFATHTTDD